MTAKTVVVVQARTGSTRLPGKILLPLAGRPLLARMIERLRAASTPTEIVIATTTSPKDDPVVDLARSLDCPFFRGSEVDLLERHVMAARERRADVVVKIPSDCPIIDPSIVDEVIGFFLADAASFDFVSNLHPGTWPDGNDVEVTSLETLEIAHREAKAPHEREHTTPFLWDRPERFRVGNVRWKSGKDLSRTHRFTIDYAEDYAFLKAVYDELHERYGAVFSLDAILDLLERRPDIHRLNAKYAGVNWYRHHLGELRTIDASETRNPE